MLVLKMNQYVTYVVIKCLGVNVVRYLLAPVVVNMVRVNVVKPIFSRI
jgi:hypothetical protein